MGYDSDSYYSESDNEYVEEWEMQDEKLIDKIRAEKYPSDARIKELISLVREQECKYMKKYTAEDDTLSICDPRQNRCRSLVLHDKRAVKTMTKMQVDHFRQNRDEIQYKYLRRFNDPRYEVLEDDLAVPWQYNIDQDADDIDAPIVTLEDGYSRTTLVWYPVDIEDDDYREDEITRVHDMRPSNLQDIVDSLRNIEVKAEINKVICDIMNSHRAEYKYAYAIQCSILAGLVHAELTSEYIQQHFDYLQNHTSGLDLVLIAHKIIDTVNYIAWRPFQYTSAQIPRLFKITSLNLRWRLPDIASVAVIFKRECLSFPACGQHYYVKNEDVDKHIQEQLAIHERDQFVLHAIIGQHTRTVLDIDLKRSEFTKEQWDKVQGESAAKLKSYIDSIAWTVAAFEVPSKKRSEPVFTWYKTADKISIRYSMGITCNVKAQYQILNSLKESHDRKTADNMYMLETPIQSMIVKAIDLAVHRRGASYRLPYFNKIAKEGDKYIYVSKSRTFMPVQDCDSIHIIKQCLSVFVEQLDDVSNRQQLPIPICGIRYTSTGTTREKTVDQLTAIKNAVTALIKVECTVDINNGFWQICAQGPPYCPLCKKTHQLDNMYQFSVYKRKDNEALNYYMNCVSRIGQTGNRLRISIDGSETEYIRSEDEILESQIMNLVIRRDVGDVDWKNDVLSEQSGALVNALYKRKTDYDFFQRYLPLFDKNKQYKEINQQFLDQSVVDQIKQHITCIRSPMGSNKTGILELYIEQNAPKSVLWLQTRKSYGHSVQQRLARFKFQRYDDEEHVAKSIEVSRGRIIVQAESINRCSKEQFDVLILDEFMSILQQLHNKTSLFAKLHQLIESAKRVIILDAQLELSAFQTLTNTFTRPGCRLPMFVINHYQPFTARTLTAYNRDASLPRVREAISKLIYERMQTQNVFVFVSSMSQQLQILQDLQRMDSYNPSTTLVLNSETPDAFKRQIFADVTNETRKYKLMITTSTLTIGVDINTNHFTTAVGIFSHNCSSAQQFIQGVHRPRQLKHVFIFSEGDRPTPFLPTTAYIRTQSEVSYNDVFTKHNKIVTPDKLMQYAALYQNTVANSPFSYIINAFQSMGYQLTDAEDYVLTLDLIETGTKYTLDKPKHIPQCSKKYTPTLKIYRHYLQSIGGQQVTEQQVREYLDHLVEKYEDGIDKRASVIEKELLEDFDVAPEQTDQVSLNMFIKHAHVLLHNFSERPTTAKRLLQQTMILTNAMLYINQIQMPIEMLLKATNAYHAGTFIRSVRNLILTYEDDSTEERKTKHKITLEKCKTWILDNLSNANAQRFVQLSAKQQRDLLDRKVREVVPTVYEKGTTRLPKEQYLLEVFKTTLKVNGKVIVPVYDFRQSYPAFTPGLSPEDHNERIEKGIPVNPFEEAQKQLKQQNEIWEQHGRPQFTCCERDY